MKTIEMTSDFVYWTSDRRGIHFKAGEVYSKVLETAALKIVKAGCGRVVEESDAAISARGAFRKP